jgi:hypothetical protein
MELPLEWSPVESERLWQQQQFKRMFPNLENDQPDWQRLNFFINAGLEYLGLTGKENPKTRVELNETISGMTEQDIDNKLNELSQAFKPTSSHPFLNMRGNATSFDYKKAT